MQQWILSNYEIFLLIHFIGFIIGLGAATVSDYMFFRSIRDLKISKNEFQTLNAISKLVWVGVIIFTISGTFLFLGKYDYLINSSSFLAKISIVAVVVFNGIFLHTKVTPHLRNITFKEKIKKRDKVLRLQALIGGIVSATSWYSALFLAITKGYGKSYSQIMLAYSSILFVGILVCLVLSKYSHKMKKF